MDNWLSPLYASDDLKDDVMVIKSRVIRDECVKDYHNISKYIGSLFQCLPICGIYKGKQKSFW